jgi:hypothetical protein
LAIKPSWHVPKEDRFCGSGKKMYILIAESNGFLEFRWPGETIDRKTAAKTRQLGISAQDD